MSAILIEVLCSAAAAPVVSDNLMRVQCDIPSGTMQAFFEKRTTIGPDVFAQPWESVSWPIDSARTVTYNFGGQEHTETYAQAMTAMKAIAVQERTNPAP